MFIYLDLHNKSFLFLHKISAGEVSGHCGKFKLNNFLKRLDSCYFFVNKPFFLVLKKGSFWISTEIYFAKCLNIELF